MFKVVSAFPKEYHAGLTYLIVGEKRDKMLLVMEKDSRFGFPGGKKDAKDENADACISREFTEEVGVVLDDDSKEERPIQGLGLEPVQAPGLEPLANTTCKTIGKFTWSTKAGIVSAIRLAYVDTFDHSKKLDNSDGEIVGWVLMKIGMVEQMCFGNTETKLRHVSIGSTGAILDWMKKNGYVWDPIHVETPFNIQRKPGGFPPRQEQGCVTQYAGRSQQFVGDRHGSEKIMSWRREEPAVEDEH